MDKRPTGRAATHGRGTPAADRRSQVMMLNDPETRVDAGPTPARYMLINRSNQLRALTGRQRTVVQTEYRDQRYDPLPPVTAPQPVHQQIFNKLNLPLCPPALLQSLVGIELLCHGAEAQH